MKRIFAYILLIVFLSALYGHFVVFKAISYSVKKSQRELLLKGIPESQVEKLAVPISDIDSKNGEFERIKDWEICYKGIMFDFFREVEKVDTIYFYGITDHKENKLLAELKNNIKNSNKVPDANTNAVKLYKRLISLTFTVFDNDDRIIFLSFSKKKTQKNLIKIENTFQPVEPPPKVS